MVVVMRFNEIAGLLNVVDCQIARLGGLFNFIRVYLFGSVFIWLSGNSRMYGHLRYGAAGGLATGECVEVQECGRLAAVCV